MNEAVGMMKNVRVLASVALMGCMSEGDRVGFTQGQDAGLDGMVSKDIGLPDVNRDALQVRETGPVVITEDAACATTTADARRRPMNLLIVLDRSSSMSERGTGAPMTAPTKWQAAVAAVRSLVMSLDDDTRVGITFFPSTSQQDSVMGYTMPAVPIGPLRTTRAVILPRLAATQPTGNTPMACALGGSIAYFRGLTLDGSHNQILVTDGIPTEECTDTAAMCGGIPVGIDILAFMRWAACRDAAGKSAVRVQVALGQRETVPVRTFVAGTPEASDMFLSDLAVTGGSSRTATCRTTQNCHYSLRTGSFESDLTMAFDEIRGRALSCEFDITVDPTRADPTRVNVNFQGTGDASPRLVPRDASHANGWDYTSGMRAITVYGPTCDRLRTDAMARVRILFGCPTITPG
jgi:hypothetical protein